MSHRFTPFPALPRLDCVHPSLSSSGISSEDAGRLPGWSNYNLDSAKNSKKTAVVAGKEEIFGTSRRNPHHLYPHKAILGCQNRVKYTERNKEEARTHLVRSAMELVELIAPLALDKAGLTLCV
ncbi:hypothetical protein OIU84_016909 [Salix udensis]|uniref:Uncharacterized protein n=1 Tax=Salix udensis TaxID=889485 RepID=A0AAD6NQV2_9ROSI|nr:hypothetical protein OIU84_016909 [Salix udensis]